MQQVTRTFSVTSPNTTCLPGEVLAPIKMNYSCQLVVQSKDSKEKIPQCFYLVTSVQKCPGAFGSYGPENNASCFTGDCRAPSGAEEKLSQWGEEQMNSWDVVWAGHQALLQQTPGHGQREIPGHREEGPLPHPSSTNRSI